jgi:hypothetical protein
MQADNVWNDFMALPLEARREVEDFIAFLRQRYQTPTANKRTSKVELGEEPFVGMWKDRADMQDSTEWVRDLRQREWTR